MRQRRPRSLWLARHTRARCSSTTAAITQTPSVANPVSPATYAMFQPETAMTDAAPRSKTVLTTLWAIATGQTVPARSQTQA